MDDKDEIPIQDSIGRMQNTPVISESGLYALIFGAIRIVQLNNETYFVGKDIAEALGYANPKNAVPAHVSEEDKQIPKMGMW